MFVKASLQSSDRELNIPLFEGAIFFNSFMDMIQEIEGCLYSTLSTKIKEKEKTLRLIDEESLSVSICELSDGGNALTTSYPLNAFINTMDSFTILLLTGGYMA